MSATPIERLDVPPSDRLEFDEKELLAEPVYDQPLFAGGVRCHGGFIGDRYVSPRMLVRGPAVVAWQKRLHDEGNPLLYVPRDLMPPHYPNLEQARLLLLEGIRDPIVRSLTMISIVEGFGAIIRDVPLPDLRKAVVEDIGGTALDHLGRGLFEAHARDEAGHRDQGGHKQMWEAARDLALDDPEIPGDVLMRMMTGRGRRRPEPLFPTLPEKVENLIATMANVMVVEIFATNVFAWGEALLGDPEVSSEPERASAMVRNIRSDELPHVEYLRTALSEIRCRSLRTEDGGRIPGAEVVDGLLARQLRGIGTTRPAQQREQVRSEIREALDEERLATDLLRRFDALDSGWTFPKTEDERIEPTLVLPA